MVLSHAPDEDVFVFLSAAALTRFVPPIAGTNFRKFSGMQLSPASS